jgi:hypothetical protein
MECKTCRYFYNGECRKYAPRVISKFEIPADYCAFPLVEKDCFCFEYELNHKLCK